MATKLTQKRLKEVVGYTPEIGIFTRTQTISNQVEKSIFGYPEKGGYLVGMIDGYKYKLHRLVWLWEYGYFPENEIDHINKIKTDNRIENLREVSRQCNMRNTGCWVTNKSGVKGVSWKKTHKSYEANITVNYKRIRLGYYKSFSNAVCARLVAEQCLEWEGCDSNSPAYKYVKEYIL